MNQKGTLNDVQKTVDDIIFLRNRVVLLKKEIAGIFDKLRPIEKEIEVVEGYLQEIAHVGENLKRSPLSNQQKT